MSKNFIPNLISIDDCLKLDSKKITVDPNKTYSVTSSVFCKRGMSFSSYLAAILLDSNCVEIDRKIRWINTTEEEQKYEIIFSSTKETKYLILGYRINVETPMKGDFDITLQHPSTIHMSESTQENSFDDINQFEIPQQKSLTSDDELMIEKNTVWLCGSPRSGTTWLGVRITQL